MLLYKFYFDGTEVENPVSWEDMTTSIKRDRALKGSFITLDVTLTFTSTGQAYLWDALQNDGWCRSVDLQVLESRDAGSNYHVFYDGVIKVSDVDFMGRQVNLEETIIVEQYAKCKVLDNSYFSRLHENKAVKTNPFAGKSKNGTVITPASIESMRLFDPSTGTVMGLVQTYGCVTLHEAFRVLLAFATDDRVDYESTLFDTGGEFENVILTYGIPIRNEGAGVSITQANFIKDFPQLDFQTLFKEANNILNLGIYVDNTGVRPKIKIERYQDLFKEDSILQIPNIDRINTKIKVEEIFARMIIGSNTILDQSALSFPELIPWIGMNKEEYFIVGDCNVDTSIDLVGDFIRSSNVIEQILINDTTDRSYDKNIFIIDCDKSPDWYDAIASNWITTGPPYFYNERFTNSNIGNRYLGAVPNNIAAYLGPALNTEFRASLLPNNDAPHVTPIGNTFTKSPCIFNNDTVSPNFDPSAVFNTSTYEFTAPATGVYSFNTGIKILLRMEVNFGFNQLVEWRVNLKIRKYDSGSILIGVYEMINRWDVEFTNFSGGQGNVWINIGRDYLGSVGINMNTNDYCIVEFEISDVTTGFNILRNEYDVWILKDSYFSCTANETSGGTFTTYNPDDYPIIADTFEHELSKRDFDLILAKPLSIIEYSQGARSFKRGWIDELKYNHFTGMGAFRLLTTRSGQPEIDVPCLPSYGDNVFDNNDFSAGDTVWNKLQNPASWTIDATGATHIPPGPGFPFDAIANSSPVASTQSPTGKWKVTVTVSGMTAGDYYVILGGYQGLTRTTNGTFTEIIDTGIDFASDFIVLVSDDFDGKIEFTEARAIINC